LSMLPVRNCM